MNALSFMSANYVARQLDYTAHGLKLRFPTEEVAQSVTV